MRRPASPVRVARGWRTAVRWAVVAFIVLGVAALVIAAASN
ncbi:MAG: hypothetical protein WDA60_17760 [Acidimicrobiia bacterium]|jgi:hypothetical protein